METSPNIKILGQHLIQCTQCQEAAKEAMAGNQIFWDEEVWSVFCCVLGKQLRIDAQEGTP